MYLGKLLLIQDIATVEAKIGRCFTEGDFRLNFLSELVTCLNWFGVVFVLELLGVVVANIICCM